MGIKQNIIGMFYGKCNIYEAEKNIDERGVTNESFKLAYSDIECRLVFGSRKNYAAHRAAGSAEHKNDARLSVSIFLAKDIDVKAGSVIKLWQNGKLYRLRSTGEGAVYTYHQEIVALPDYSEV